MKNVFCLLIAIVSATACLRAETVAEWKFQNDGEVIGGQPVALDVAATGASATSKLMERTTVAPLETGISDKWSDFLKKGYLNSPSGVGQNSKDQCGLRTEPANAGEKNGGYRNYMGFVGLGTADKSAGGTIYLVVKPNNGWAEKVRRRVLFGTGHTIDGIVRLMMDDKGMLTMTAGGISNSGRHDAVTASLPVTFEPEKWYLIAGSWQEGAPTIVYVREMPEAGPAGAPEAKTAQSESPAPTATTMPDSQPLAVGAFYLDTGGEQYLTDGADADIAYARLDNSFSSQADIDAVFNSLGKP